VFDAVRPWFGAERTLAGLNQAAESIQLKTESGQPVRFVPPGTKDLYYEIRVFETGRVETRPDSLHDWFNALAWLAFPKTKALINALHAEEIPKEGARRGRRRDLLTLLDEGGVIVHCDDDELVALVRTRQWKALFWEQRKALAQRLRFCVLGHATLEQALNPRPGIACKALVVPFAAPADAAAHAWLARLAANATPRDLPAVPIFGYPGWLRDSAQAGFYDDERYFRETPDTVVRARPAPPPDAGA